MGGGVQGGAEDLVHVVVTVAAQAAAEEHLRPGAGQLLIPGQQSLVLFVVDGIIGLLPRLPGGGVLPGEDGFLLGAKLEVLVLDNTGVGHLPGGVVHHGAALVIGAVPHLSLKTEGTVFQGAVAIVEEPVDGAGVHGFPGGVRVGGCKAFIGGGEEHIAARKQPLHQGVVPLQGDALMGVGEVVVVKGKAQGHPLQDEGGQLFAVPSPLLLRVALDELLVDVVPHQLQGLLLQVLGLLNGVAGRLALDLRLGLGGGLDVPQFGEGVHVEGKVIQLIVVDGHGGVDKMVEPDKPVHILPHALIGGVEDVGPIPVHLDALHHLTVGIARDVGPPVNDQAPLSRGGHLLGKSRAVEARPHNQIIVFHSSTSFPPVPGSVAVFLPALRKGRPPT